LQVPPPTQADTTQTSVPQGWVGKYIIPARRYFKNMGTHWWFSQGRPGCSASAAVVARLEEGVTPVDPSLAQLAAASTQQQLQEDAGLVFYSRKCPRGGPVDHAAEEEEDLQEVGWQGKGRGEVCVRV
jgi:hypothetical protein